MQTIKTDYDIKIDQLKVLSVAEGFFGFSVLLALLKLKVFESIGENGKKLNDIALSLDVQPGTLARLMNAGVVLNLLETSDGITYRVASACRSVLLPSSGEHYLGNWIRNLEYFYLALSKLDEAVLKSGPTVDPSTSVGLDKEHTREFSLAMHNYASLRGKELSRFLDTTGCRSLLDLGCGPGTYGYCLGMANPDLELHLADFPAVLEVAKEVRMMYPLKNKISYLPLDAVKDDIPGSYDMILVSNTLHGLGESESRNLIRKLYGSINQGGSLVIQAQFLQDDHRGGRWPVLLDIMMLCVTEKGRNHSVAETKQWLEEACFSNIEFCPMTLLNTNCFLRGYN
jgi:SAM-dependent methyltransferase